MLLLMLLIVITSEYQPFLGYLQLIRDLYLYMEEQVSRFFIKK